MCNVFNTIIYLVVPVQPATEGRENFKSLDFPPIVMSHLAAFGYALIYVGSLYISKNARLSFTSDPNYGKRERERRPEERWRDDDDVIRARLTAVSIATVVCCLVFIFQDGLRHLGLTHLLASPTAYMAVPILFLGPLYGLCLQEELPFQAEAESIVETLKTWQGIRNYVLVCFILRA